MATKRTDPYYPDAKRSTTYDDGTEYQDFVSAILQHKMGIGLQILSSKRYQLAYGESVQGVEVKQDVRCTETGRLSIEVGEKSRISMPEYTASGILRSDNTWLYIQGNYEHLWAFPKKTLVAVYEGAFTAPPWNIPKPRIDDKGTIQTFYLSRAQADLLSAFHFDISEREQALLRPWAQSERQERLLP